MNANFEQCVIHPFKYNHFLLTPLLLDIMATIGLQVLVAGLYLSAEDNSVQSSRPPTKHKFLLEKMMLIIIQYLLKCLVTHH